MAAAVSVRQLQWKQRLAFVRHNLHTASITRDFSFFKCLQAFSLINASDHLSTLTSILGDDDGQADSLILTLDKFNTVIACVHEDAFRNVYDSVRATFSDKPKKEKERQMLYHTEAASQRQMASNSIDKMFNSAVDAIRQHPQASQDSAAHVFITGCTFTAVAMEVALAELENIGQNLNDSSRLDSSWAVVQAAVAQTVSGMKGVFKLMADSDNGTVEEPQQKRHERSGSVDGYAKSMLRRMSTALTAPLYGNSSSASSLTSPTLPSRSSSSTSFISAPSRRDSALSFTTPERSTGVGNASVNWGPSIKRSHSGHTGAMSPIPSTPSATDSNSADDPFDIASANDMAFVNNCHTASNLDVQSTEANPAKHSRSQSFPFEDSLHRVSPPENPKLVPGELSATSHSARNFSLPILDRTGRPITPPESPGGCRRSHNYHSIRGEAPLLELDEVV